MATSRKPPRPDDVFDAEPLCEPEELDAIYGPCPVMTEADLEAFLGTALPRDDAED